MIGNKSAMDLGAIAARGGGLEVDGHSYSAMDLGAIAARLSNGAYLKIHNSDGISAMDMGSIAARKPGQVIFC